MPIDVNVTNPVVPVASAGTPVHFVLKGLFTTNSVNLGTTILGPISYTIPAGFSRLLVRHVSCEAIVTAGAKVQIFLNREFAYANSAGPESLVQLIPDNEIIVYGTPRQVANAEVHAYLGITTPGGPVTGDTLTLAAQKKAESELGGVTCVVAGELFE